MDGGNGRNWNNEFQATDQTYSNPTIQKVTTKSLICICFLYDIIINAIFVLSFYTVGTLIMHIHKHILRLKKAEVTHILRVRIDRNICQNPACLSFSCIFYWITNIAIFRMHKPKIYRQKCVLKCYRQCNSIYWMHYANRVFFSLFEIKLNFSFSRPLILVRCLRACFSIF